MKKHILISLLGFFCFASQVFSQDTLSISKSEIWQKASDKNLQIKIANQQVLSAKADYNQSNSLFLPNVSASYTGLTTTNPLMAFGSKLNQGILTASDFNPDLLNNPTETQNFATKIDVIQPLLNLDGIYGRKAAKSTMEAYQLQSERTIEYLELEVNKAYIQLQMAYKAVEVIEKANATASENLKLIENYYKQGMLQKTDLLSMQVRINDVKNQYQYAKSNVQNASDYLAYLLGEDNKDKVYKPAETLDNSITIENYSLTISDNRKDIQAIQKTSDAYEKMLQSSKMNFAPRLNAFGSYEWYDNTIFAANSGGYLVGAQLLWNVFDGYKSIGKMQKAKSDFQKSEFESQEYKSKSQLELNKANRQLVDAENKVNLEKLALEQSQEAYRIRSNRFEQGLEKTSDLLLSETQMYQKELEFLQAVFEYNYTQQYLQFLTK